MAITLADIYQGANITLQADIFALRRQSVTAMKDALTDEHSTVLARLYFGLQITDEDAEWFRSEVGKNDPMFSLVQNGREAAVLSESILWEAVQGGDAFAATVVLSAESSGLRAPVVNAQHIAAFRTTLNNMAVRERSSIQAKIKSLPPSTITADQFAGAASLPAAAALYGQANDELRKTAQSAFTETQKILASTVDQLEEAREEVDILWWLIGGWSRRLDCPFNSLSPGTAAVAVGVDLADLSRGVEGPFAATSLIRRALLPLKKPRGGKISFASLGDALKEEEFKSLDICSSLTNLGDLCPVLTAASKSAEMGHGAWFTSFEKITGLQAKSDLDVEILALQAMRERIVTAQL
jgi:hypothetical protein